MYYSVNKGPKPDNNLNELVIQGVIQIRIIFVVFGLIFVFMIMIVLCYI
jgi:hypothetical protein